MDEGKDFDLIFVSCLSQCLAHNGHTISAVWTSSLTSWTLTHANMGMPSRFLLARLFYIPVSSFPSQVWKYLMEGSAYLVMALFNFFPPYFLPVLVQCLSRNWKNLWVAIFHLDNVVVNFFSILQDEYFYFPKANMLYYITKYTVQGSFSPNGPSLYSYSFLNFNRFPDTTVNLPFWDVAKSSRQFETASMCTEQAP